MQTLKVNKNMLFMAADGDGIGKKVGRAVIANDVDSLHKISARIDAAQDFILHWCKQQDGIKISGGGDEFTASIPESAEEDIESLRKDIEHAFGFTISVGIGKSLSEAGTSLLVAKLRGKNRIVKYTEELKKEIEKSRKRVKKGKATQEEYKLAEAYLEKKEENMADKPKEKDDEKSDPTTEKVDCQYCDETDGVDKDHCKYCHDEDVEATEESCPYCKESDAEASAGLDDCPYCKEQAEGTEADCPYCKENGASDTPQAEDSPASTDQPEDPNMNPPIIEKPQVGDGNSPSGSTLEAPAANAQASEVTSSPGDLHPEDTHSKEAMMAIAQRIEGETADGKPDDKQAASQIDDTAIAGNEMQGNVSRPDNFESNNPGDTGLDSEHASDENIQDTNSPDMGSVLQEGLDNNADDIQREKVREMVGQALVGFKASKDVLETAKQQAPELYNASIMMLKAMIEMARMLGMGSAQGAVNEITNGASAGNPGADEWSEPFPTHPDQGGERKPGHAAGQEDAAEAPKALG